MVWYNPFSWGKEETPAAAPAVAAPSSDYPPSTPTYGGRHKGRKHRKTYRGGKKHRSKTGRRRHR